MGVVDQIEKIFNDPKNFDESGFAHIGLITPELAANLMDISEKDMRALEKRGYSFSWFSGSAHHSDGIVHKWYREKGGKIKYSRRLYYNQNFLTMNDKGGTEND